MAVTVLKVQNTFEEFRKTDPATVKAKLALAELEVNRTVWGARADAGVLFMTAHLLSLTPAAVNAKLKPENQAKTIYLAQFDRMKRAVTFGFRTAGLPPAGATEGGEGG